MNKDGNFANVNLLPFLFYMMAFLLVIIGMTACGPSVDPGMGEAFLEAINIEDYETADQYVCPAQQGQIGQAILNKAQVPPKGMDVFGLTSPGMAEISCSLEGGEEMSCSFWSPELQCTGNILAGEEVTCNSWKLKGQFYTLQFVLEDGKICGYSLDR